MAISRELKAYINRKYEERIAVKVALKSEALSKARTEHTAKYRSQAITLAEETVQNLIDQMELLRTDGFSITYDGKAFMKNGIMQIVNLPQFNEVAKVSKIYDRQIELINAEREKLLVIISLEKNFDTINIMLNKYDIAF